MATFLPSTNPASFRPCRKGSTIYAKPVAGVLLRNPATGIAACCARTASGHAAAAPPSVAKDFRRPMVTAIRPSRARCVKERIPRYEGAVFMFKVGRMLDILLRRTRPETCSLVHRPVVTDKSHLDGRASRSHHIALH